MYGYQGKAVRAGSAQGAVKVFSAGRWRLFRAGAGAGAGFHRETLISYHRVIPRGRGRGGIRKGISLRDTFLSARARARGN